MQFNKSGTWPPKGPSDKEKCKTNKIFWTGLLILNSGTTIFSIIYSLPTLQAAYSTDLAIIATSNGVGLCCQQTLLVHDWGPPSDSWSEATQRNAMPLLRIRDDDTGRRRPRMSTSWWPCWECVWWAAWLDRGTRHALPRRSPPSTESARIAGNDCLLLASAYEPPLQHQRECLRKKLNLLNLNNTCLHRCLNARLLPHADFTKKEMYHCKQWAIATDAASSIIISISSNNNSSKSMIYFFFSVTVSSGTGIGKTACTGNGMPQLWPRYPH